MVPLSSLNRNLVERHVLVDADVAGQTQHALGDDVAQDFIGAAGDPHRGRTQQHLLELPAHLFLGSAGKDTGRAFEIRVHKFGSRS